jgi:hypothetical protein
MTAQAALAFPGSRILAGWWRQLVPHRPEETWIAHLSLHRVEALVELAHPHRPDPLSLLVLQALRLENAVAAPPEETLFRLDACFHLGRPLLRQALRALAADGLVREEPRGWVLTALGEQAAERGEYPRCSRERRGFHFVEPRGADGAPAGPPHFLNLNGHSPVPYPAGEEWQFDPAALRAALDRPAEWKERYGFPLNVRALIGPEAEAVPAWQQVIVDRPERLLTVMTPVGGEGKRRLLGFAVRQEGWVLLADAPAFEVRDRWHELFPELAGLPAEAWRRAWLAWCQPRGLPTAEVEACAVEPQGVKLRVRAPAKLIDRLRAQRSDAVKGEAWVLVGEGAVRRAVLLDLAEASGR